MPASTHSEEPIACRIAFKPSRFLSYGVAVYRNLTAAVEFLEHDIKISMSATLVRQGSGQQRPHDDQLLGAEQAKDHNKRLTSNGMGFASDRCRSGVSSPRGYNIRKREARRGLRTIEYQRTDNGIFGTMILVSGTVSKEATE